MQCKQIAFLCGPRERARVGYSHTFVRLRPNWPSWMLFRCVRGRARNEAAAGGVTGSPGNGVTARRRAQRSGLLQAFGCSASKVNVEIADSTYLPADAALKNFEEAGDNLLLVVAAEYRR
jgi:hypothetical protein